MFLLGECSFSLTFLHPTQTVLLWWGQSWERPTPWFIVPIRNCLHDPGKSKIATEKNRKAVFLSMFFTTVFWLLFQKSQVLVNWPMYVSCEYERGYFVSRIYFDIATSLFSKSLGSDFGGGLIIFFFVSLTWFCLPSRAVFIKSGSDISAFLVWNHFRDFI